MDRSLTRASPFLGAEQRIDLFLVMWAASGGRRVVVVTDVLEIGPGDLKLVDPVGESIDLFVDDVPPSRGIVGIA